LVTYFINLDPNILMSRGISNLSSRCRKSVYKIQNDSLTKENRVTRFGYVTMTQREWNQKTKSYDQKMLHRNKL